MPQDILKALSAPGRSKMFSAAPTKAPTRVAALVQAAMDQRKLTIDSSPGVGTIVVIVALASRVRP